MIARTPGAGEVRERAGQMRAREFPAISLHQPWASLIFAGVKRHETRAFPLPVRLIGEQVAIHAAKRRPADLPGLDRICWAHLGPDWQRHVPLGRVLGLVRFGAPIRTGGDLVPDGIDREVGNWGPGRWVWPVLEFQALIRPPEATGRQGWWRVTLDPPAQLGEACDSTQGSVI